MRLAASSPFALHPREPMRFSVLADRKRADARQMRVGQGGFVRPGVELRLDPGEVALRGHGPQRCRGRRRAGRRRRLSTSRTRPSRETSRASGRWRRRADCRDRPEPRAARPRRTTATAARNLPKLPCSLATSWTKRAFDRTDPIFGPLRTIRASLVSASQYSSGSKARRAGSKPRKASSKPGHFDSMTLQAKPAENTRLVISASARSSGSSRNALGSGLGGKRRASASAPPLRFSARARMVLNAVNPASFVCQCRLQTRRGCFRAQSPSRHGHSREICLGPASESS